MKKSSRSGVLATGTVALATALTMIATGTANAAIAQSGGNLVRANQHCAAAFDGESDGHGVYADVHLVDGTHFSVWDGSGSDGKWGPTTCWSSRIAKVRVVEDKGPASGWVYNPN
ncbi:hypothetical protein [Allokutzneria sp. NRRL B-24872]|uniref:hypothetical protein n=1 Tax=Allokutzneria sp. NRRL B-24872 TaxID=1137961 RepID=UPI0011789AFE|nr:hypothetical protein [Allokutzneria sp. NRRL B-24872]